jgi:hypothetical protein
MEELAPLDLLNVRRTEGHFTDIWEYFIIEEGELEAFKLPEEAPNRQLHNKFPKEIYARDHTTDTEEQLFCIYFEICGNSKEIANPYTDSRLSNIPVNDVSVETMLRKFRQFVKILNFPEDLSLRQIFWELIRPKNIVIFINLAQKFKMSKKTMAHIAEYSYRLAWLMNSKKFVELIGISHLNEVCFRSFYSTLGKWYCRNIPLMITDGKRSTMNHRDLDTLKAQKRWEDTEKFIALLEIFNNEITSESPVKLLRNCAIFSFIVSTAPPRTQNLRLMVIPSGVMKTNVEIKELVDSNNQSLLMKEKHYKSLTGAIFLDKTEEGHYKIVWTYFKTVKSFSLQTRIVSHPVTVKLFDMWKDVRSNQNYHFWQNESGAPLYKLGECFKWVCQKYLNKMVTISDYRIISTTKMKTVGTHKQYLEFANLCLHSETISNVHYVKNNVGIEQQKTISDLLVVLGSNTEAKINQCIGDVRKFLNENPEQLDFKIESMRNFLGSFKDIGREVIPTPVPLQDQIDEIGRALEVEDHSEEESPIRSLNLSR